MKPYLLTRDERNRVFSFVHALGLHHSDFDWADVEQAYNSHLEITHRPTHYAFHISDGFDSNYRISYYTECSPVVEDVAKRRFDSREDLLRAVERWLRVVKREHETPDLWAAVLEEGELVGASATDGDRPFTPSERKAIEEGLHHLQQQIVRIATPDAAQAERLEGAINAMNAATAEMTRSQWKHLFIGALLEALLSLGLESVPVREVLHYATIYIGPVVAHIRGWIG